MVAFAFIGDEVLRVSRMLENVPTDCPPIGDMGPIEEETRVCESYGELDEWARDGTADVLEIMPCTGEVSDADEVVLEITEDVDAPPTPLAWFTDDRPKS